MAPINLQLYQTITPITPSPPPHHCPHHTIATTTPSPPQEAKPYAFDYGVKDEYSGANFGHSEKSDGNAVQGSYQVALPDGRIQIVR